MKFAICNETFLDWPLDRACALRRSAATRASRSPLSRWPPGRATFRPPSAKRSAARRKRPGLEVVGLHWLLAKTEGFHLTSPDAAVRQRTADYLVDLTLFCGDLGGKVMVLGSPVQRNLAEGMTKAQGMAYAAEVLCAVLPVLESNRVVLAVEPLAPQETNFLLTAADAVELIDRVGSPQVRLHLDCKAMASEATPIVELIRQNRQLAGPFPRQRSQSARPRLRVAGLRADLQGIEGSWLRRLGFGRGLRLLAGDRKAGTREHRVHAAMLLTDQRTTAKMAVLGAKRSTET